MYRIFILFLVLLVMCVNGIEFCGNKGFYVNVKPQVYKLFCPLETITKDWIQIDSI